MKKGIFISLFLLLSACTRVEPPPKEPTIKINSIEFKVNGDTILIDEIRWKWAKLGDYPFTTGGDLACSNNSVEFYPDSFHEQDIGLPLNKVAQERFKQANLTPNVANVIKTNTDLSQAVKLGLIICDFNNKQMKQATKQP